MKIVKLLLVLGLVFLTSCNNADIQDTQTASETEQDNVQNVDNNLDNNTETTMTQRKLQNGDKVAIITTNKGKIEIYLDTENAPITANNFIGLAKEGYYDGIVFHRVIPGFMIQGGDPDGTGMGGTSLYGEKFTDEFSEKLSNTKFTISMANSGPNTNGSQFFINVADNINLDFNKEPLTSKHAVFGEVVNGKDNVLAISKVKTTGADRPEKEVKMIKVEVKEYKDGKYVDFDFDKQQAIKLYEDKQEELKKQEEEKKKKALEVDDTATIKFTLKDADGKEITSGTQSLPLVEDAELLTGLQEALLGMKIGDTKTVTLPPEKGYGEYREDLIQSIPKSNLADFEKNGFEFKKGVKLPTQLGELEIVEVSDNEVKLDTNLPFAGETVIFDFEVTDIN